MRLIIRLYLSLLVLFGRPLPAVPPPDRPQPLPPGPVFFTLVGMRDFATKLIRAAQNHETFDAAMLTEIQASCIRDLKNAEPIGLSIDDEATMIGQAIEDLEQLMQLAIAEAGQPQ